MDSPTSDRQLRAGNSELNYMLATLGFERDNDTDDDFVVKESLSSEEFDADDKPNTTRGEKKDDKSKGRGTAAEPPEIKSTTTVLKPYSPHKVSPPPTKKRKVW
ncbi:hypothetical protein F441_22669, partial [Phytophthora nicotianae CJ01A1]